MAVKRILDLGIDEFDHDFAEVLQRTRYVAGGGFGCFHKQPQKRLPSAIEKNMVSKCRVQKPPLPHLEIEPEIGQVVNDISRCGMTGFAHSVLTEASNVKGNASQYAISAAI
jgi:hypothetical protein